jgi:hypothetical protein
VLPNKSLKLIVLGLIWGLVGPSGCGRVGANCPLPPGSLARGRWAAGVYLMVSRSM